MADMHLSGGDIPLVLEKRTQDYIEMEHQKSIEQLQNMHWVNYNSRHDASSITEIKKYLDKSSV